MKCSKLTDVLITPAPKGGIFVLPLGNWLRKSIVSINNFAFLPAVTNFIVTCCCFPIFQRTYINLTICRFGNVTIEWYYSWPTPSLYLLRLSWNWTTFKAFNLASIRPIRSLLKNLYFFIYTCFPNWECKGKCLFWLGKIYFDYFSNRILTLFTRFFFGTAKVSSYSTATNFIFQKFS